MIETSNSVIIHIRGGDLKDLNWVTNLFFYQNAVHKMETILGKDLVYYVFTNDPELSHTYLAKMPKRTYHLISETYNFNSMEEFSLMTYGKHFIYALSTFSQMAGWLAPYKRKQIISYTSSHMVDSN